MAKTAVDADATDIIDDEGSNFNPDEGVTGVETAEDFSNRILGSSVTTSGYAEHFIENFSFYGKSLEDWAADLQVKVPEDAEPHELRRLWIRLANNVQIAGHFKAVSTSIYNAMASGMKIQKDDLINALVRHYINAGIRRPAAEVLKSMADSYMKDSTMSRESAKLSKDFWQQKYESLVEVRKCLEQLNMSIITEHKYAGGSEDPE